MDMRTPKRARRQRVYADLLTNRAPSPADLRRAFGVIVENDGVAFDGTPTPADFGRKVAQLVDTGMSLAAAFDLARNALGRCEAVDGADMAGWKRWRVYGELADVEALTPERLRALGSRVVDTGATMSAKLVREVASRRLGLPSGHKAVLLLLSHHVDDKDGYTWVSAKRLARELEISERQCKRILAELQKRGVVECDMHGHVLPGRRRQWSPNRWRIRVEQLPEIVFDDRARSDVHDTPKENLGVTCATSSGDMCDLLGVSHASPNKKEDKKEDHLASASPNANGRDELFDTLAEVCGVVVADLTKSARGALNRALADLRGVNATADEIRARAIRHRRKWPGIGVTPSSLAKHWPELGSPIRAEPARTNRPVPPKVDEPEHADGAAAIAAIREQYLPNRQEKP